LLSHVLKPTACPSLANCLPGGPDIEIEAIKLFDSVPDKAQDMIRKQMRFAADGMTLGEAEAMNERITKVRQGVSCKLKIPRIAK
jgi:hypothetical protein